MTPFTLVATQRDLARLRQILHAAAPSEAAAYVLLGRARIPRDPWSGVPSEKFMVHEIVEIAPDEILEQSPLRITWRTESFVRLLRRAREEGWVIGVVHSHPTGPTSFSGQDDESESHLCALLQRRNRTSDPLISIILAPHDTWLVRRWNSPAEVTMGTRIFVVGDRFHVRYADKVAAGVSPEAWARQALALGESLVNDLRALRVGVVGVGGTGSALVMQLARLGIGHLLLVDADHVDETNLSRLHGATRSDARHARPKVTVMAREIARMGLGTKLSCIQATVDDVSVQAPLAACDVIFGCTDDHDGRLLLNRLAYFYLTPVIDLGLGSFVDDREGGSLLSVEARVTVLVPGANCLLCHHVVDLAQARADRLRRMDPDRYAQEREEAYVVGEGNPSPAVVTFTTGVATLALEEFLHRLQGFRGSVGHANNRVRFVHLASERRPGAIVNPNCLICQDDGYWGRGDMTPHLDRAG